MRKHCLENKNHFPKANAVAVITEPHRFLDDVSKTIGCKTKHGEVHYFHIDEGLAIKGSNQRAMDMEYMKYLTTFCEVRLNIPKLKGVAFKTAIIERYRRRDMP